MIEDARLVNSLLGQGIIDPETLKEGVERTRKTGRPLYETLIFGRLVDEDKLVGLVSNLLKVAMARVDAHRIPAPVRRLVPSSMARRNRVIPLDLRNDELLLGMVDPLDVLAMDEIATHTGIDIQPVLVGPAALEEALEVLYGIETTGSDLLASFDDFDVQGMMDEVMAGDQWSELFDDDGASTEDSAVLSRDMRDRPSTDVLAEADIDAAIADENEEDLIEIEIIEELGRPSRLPAPYALLDDWEVDEALTSSSGAAQILTAEGAEEFFRADSVGALPKLQADADATGESEIPEPISELYDDTQTGKTSVGLGIDQMVDGVLGGESRTSKDDPDNTGRTSLGVGPAGAADPEETPRAITAAKPGRLKRQSLEDTDYGALGRAILKTPVAGPEAADAASTPSLEVQAPPETHPRLRTPALQLPTGVDAESLALALAHLLVAKKILTVEEIMALAARLKSEER